MSSLDNDVLYEEIPLKTSENTYGWNAGGQLERFKVFMHPIDPNALKAQLSSHRPPETCKQELVIEWSTLRRLEFEMYLSLITTNLAGRPYAFRPILCFMICRSESGLQLWWGSAGLCSPAPRIPLLQAISLPTTSKSFLILLINVLSGSRTHSMHSFNCTWFMRG